MRWRVRQLRVTKDRIESWLTKVVRHSVPRVTVLITMMHSRIMRTSIHIPGCADAEFHFCRNFSLPFRAAVLKPDFYLSFGEIKRLRKLSSTRDCEIFASVKFPLEFFNLRGSESSSFSLLAWISASSSLTCTAFVLQYWKRETTMKKYTLEIFQDVFSLVD